MPNPEWNIGLEGRAWARAEVRERWALAPEKFELVDGKLFWSAEQRLALLGMLLENVGALAAVGLGRVEIWREAVRRLDLDGTG